MKYFTKEWYENCQRTSFYFSLKVSKKAELFSDEYFNYLYKKRLREHVKSYKEYAKEMNEEFNLEACKKEFERIYQRSIVNAKDMLPNSIIQNIPDVRVLALNTASSTIYKSIKKFCLNLKEQTNHAAKEYNKHYQSIKEILPDSLMDNKLRMHDSEVVSISFRGNDFIMDIDSSGGFCKISKLVFKTAQILESFEKIDNAIWLYDEIYIVQDKYELHILFYLEQNTEKMELGQMIIRFDELEIS